MNARAIFAEVILTLVFIVIPILIGFAGYNIAKKRNRNACVWAINCALTSVFGFLVLVLSCPLTLDYNKETDDKETDTLGWAIFAAALIWFVTGYCRGFVEALEWNAYRRQEIIDFILNWLH